MTDASLPAGRFTEGEFRVGRVLSRAWSVFTGNFLKFTVVTGIAFLPSLLIPQPTAATVGNPLVNVPLFVTALLLMLGLTMVSQAIVFYAAFQGMRRMPVNLADGLKVGLSRFLPLLGLGVVILLAMFGLGMLSAVLFLVPGLKYASPLLFVPVVMLFLMWSMASPACVVERLSPIGSLGRSRELTKGHRWKILGLFLATTLPGVIIGAIVGAAMGVMIALGQTGGLGTAAMQTISLIWNAIWTAFFAIAIVVAYHDLRVAKEGVDTDQIAAVFE